MLDPAALLQVWGKTDRSKPHPRPFHPLLCHLIDVAMVALALWEEGLSSARTRWLAAALGLTPDEAGRWVAFLAGGCPHARGR